MCHILVSKKCQLQAGTIRYWGKELLTQQLTGSSTQTQPCDNAMSMGATYLLSVGSVRVLGWLVVCLLDYEHLPKFENVIEFQKF